MNPNRTHLSLALHRVFNPQGHQLATGFVIDETTRRLIPLHAWVEVLPDPERPRRGRKTNMARKAAVALAHEWHRAWRDLNQGHADCAVAGLLQYADERAARRVRVEARKKVTGRYLLAFDHASLPDHKMVLLFEKTAVVQIEGHSLIIQGMGWRWTYGEPAAVYAQWSLHAEFDPQQDIPDTFRQFVEGGDKN